MTVFDLIEHLKTFPQDLPVAYDCCSEHVLLKPDEITVQSACVPRPDGWVHDARPDKPSQQYLMLPGN